MKRKKFELIFGLFFIGIGVFLSRSSDPVKQYRENGPLRVPIAEVSPAPMRSALPAQSQIKMVHTHETSEPLPESRYKNPPQGQIVDFKVIDGLAVAYGDTVIGKLPVGVSVDSGLTEIKPTRLWVGNKIPYLIDETVQNKAAVKQALELFEARTNLKFIASDGQEDAIVFTLGKENCMSELGRSGGLQPIYLEPRCGKIEIAHEIMHALGFVHEQSRTDRDRYVNVFWQNIRPEFQDQFAMVPEALMSVYGDTPFDPTSILMYEPHIFSTAPNLETLSLKNGGTIKPNENGLSDIDILRVNRLYQL